MTAHVPFLPVRTSSRAGNMAGFDTERFIELKDKKHTTGTMSRRHVKIPGRRWDVKVITIKILFIYMVWF
jgi:hypothetical protein